MSHDYSPVAEIVWVNPQGEIVELYSRYSSLEEARRVYNMLMFEEYDDGNDWIPQLRTITYSEFL